MRRYILREKRGSDRERGVLLPWTITASHGDKHTDEQDSYRSWMTGEVRRRGMGECRRDAKVVRLVGSVFGIASCWTSREAAVVRHRREETTLAWSGIRWIVLFLLAGKAGIVRGNTPWDRKACFEAFRLGCCGLVGGRRRTTSRLSRLFEGCVRKG